MLTAMLCMQCTQMAAVCGHYCYTAWGEHVSDYSFYGGIDQVPIRYAGEYYDYESGMTYLRRGTMTSI